MALKLIKTFGVAPILVKVYYDSEWQEYTTKAVISGKVETAARWSYTDDKSDALSTAEHILKWNIGNLAKAKKAKVAKKAPKNSALAILKELEAKPRKNPVRKIKKPSKVRKPIKSYEIHAHGQHAKTFKLIAVYYDKATALQGCKDYVRHNPNDTVKLVLVY